MTPHEKPPRTLSHLGTLNAPFVCIGPKAQGAGIICGVDKRLPGASHVSHESQSLEVSRPASGLMQTPTYHFRMEPSFFPINCHTESYFATRFSKRS